MQPRRRRMGEAAKIYLPTLRINCVSVKETR